MQINYNLIFNGQPNTRVDKRSYLELNSSVPSPGSTHSQAALQCPAMAHQINIVISGSSPSKFYHSVMKMTSSCVFYCSSSYKRLAYTGSSSQHSEKLFWSPGCTKLVWGLRGEAYFKNQYNFVVAADLFLIRGQLYITKLSKVIAQKEQLSWR